MDKGNSPKGLKAIALLEITKGAFALISGVWFLSTLGKDWGTSFASLLHRFFPSAVVPERITSFFNLFDREYQAIAAIGFILYAVLHIIEGIGLWKHLHWAEWLGVFSGGIYIPFEIYELFYHPSWITFAILILNTFVVAYLIFVIKTNPKREALIS